MSVSLGLFLRGRHESRKSGVPSAYFCAIQNWFLGNWILLVRLGPTPTSFNPEQAETATLGHILNNNFLQAC